MIDKPWPIVLVDGEKRLYGHLVQCLETGGVVVTSDGKFRNIGYVYIYDAQIFNEIEKQKDASAGER